MANTRDDLKRTMPTLRSRFESSRALIERAHETAARVVEAADAMRSLLHPDTHATSPERDLWEAAAREILHGARERDRILGLLSHELRQALTRVANAGIERAFPQSAFGNSPAARETLLGQARWLIARYADMTAEYDKAVDDLAKAAK